MITITQNKVAGFEPRWAPFSGFSLLFDNPGKSILRSGDLQKIACLPQPGDELDLYFRLTKIINDIGRDFLINTYLFCPLPPSSYHVTVWDGINVDNQLSVRAELRAEWIKFLAGVPDSLHKPPISMSMVTSSDLVKRSFGDIKFQFDELTIWGNQSLVSRLAPADQVSEKRLRDLSEARRALSDKTKQDLGVAPSENYSPHISLGYFANREHGQLAHAQLSDWIDQFQHNLEGSTITFSLLAVYAFTDMASFYKVAGNQAR